MLKPPFILSIAGGGSTYTPGIVKSLMVRLSDFPLAEIRLYDIDSARQATIAPVVEKVIRDHSQTIKFTTTSDPEVAFSGAHFVFAQMRVGQYKMREQDEKIPLRHGVVGQETCGPGGLAYGLRTILPMVELIDMVERYADEKAWIVNYSNPAAIVAEGVRRLRPTARVLNICDMPVAAMRNMGAILGVDRHKLEVDYFGLNHFGWFTRVLVDGEDQLPALRRHIAKFGLLTEDAAQTDPQHSDPSWVKTWRNIKPIMDNFPDYLPNPYLQYYLMPNAIVEHQDPNYTRANEVMDGREKSCSRRRKSINVPAFSRMLSMWASTARLLWMSPARWRSIYDNGIWLSSRTKALSLTCRTTRWLKCPPTSPPQARSRCAWARCRSSTRRC